jgi:trehalose 6-phosphate synthase
MKLLSRFILPLGLVLAALAYASVLAFDHLTLRWFSRDLDARAQLTATAIYPGLRPLLEAHDQARILSLLEALTRDERLLSVAYCSLDGETEYKTSRFPPDVHCRDLLRRPGSTWHTVNDRGEMVHMAVAPLDGLGKQSGVLVFIHDLTFALQRSASSSAYVYFLFFVIGVFIAALTVLILRFTWKRWVSDLQTMIRRRGETRFLPQGTAPELLPVVNELRSLVNELEASHTGREGPRGVWNPTTLKLFLEERLAGEQILIVSNREPYVHTRTGNKIEAQVPASGLVSALEPVMRACSGTWIAHGSGNADREVVDANDRVWVPPGEESYRIRRVWLSEEEEKGYYFGFSNEGLWPLCHIAHTRPVFRTEDWKYYQLVNERFAQAVIEEAEVDNPVVLVQDYHFAMLPALLRSALPRATVITFWHIPWPNPEAFGICPWRKEILRGLLGSTILGFHTRFHRNNFLESVDRFLECRIDWESSSVSYHGDLTAVRRYPISIEWPPRWLDSSVTEADCRKKVSQRHGLNENCKLALGVDRLDYTKGILERLLAVERLLELYPEWVGTFTLIQIAAPSRSKIQAYHAFDESVTQAVERINSRFKQEKGVPPIILLKSHHSPESVFEYFRAADICLVTSLHDGMNLVAKEFVASRSDERGVLVLSMFTGASQELPEAIIVNPYDSDQCAEAMHLGLLMDEDEQRSRMRSMRMQIKEFNVYRWAGRMLVDAAETRERAQWMMRLSEPELLLSRG